ncbi:MAG: hypothetical protein ACO3CS_07960, partial [Alphaproteobacteria bacterium]
MIETRTATVHAPPPAEQAAPANADPRARARAALASGRLAAAAERDLESATRALAAELGPNRISVN